MRQYNFHLPYSFSSWQVQFAPGRLQSMGVWDKLPADLRELIMEAYNRGLGFTLLKEDLDKIDNDTWEQIEPLFA